MRIGLGRGTSIEVTMDNRALNMRLRVVRRGKTVHAETAPISGDVSGGSVWDLSQNYRLRPRLFRLGSRTVLWGYHTFWLHPWFVAAGWWKLYGVPWDPRLWVAFVVHDLGYWGLFNLDGPEGEQHPEWGARVMERWFDAHPVISPWWTLRWWTTGVCDRLWGDIRDLPYNAGSWYEFSRYHSRYLARADGKRYSLLCVADKQAMLLYPRWLFLGLVRATGEIREYLRTADRRGEVEPTAMIERWYVGVMAYTQSWISEHRDGGEDRMTRGDSKSTPSPSGDGVWR